MTKLSFDALKQRAEAIASEDLFNELFRDELKVISGGLITHQLER